MNKNENENEIIMRKASKSVSYKKRNDNNKVKIEAQSNDNLNINNISIINNNIIEKKMFERHESKESNKKKEAKNSLKFIDYLIHLISFTKLHKNIKLYSDFRIKMISEENLILCTLNIAKMQKNYNLGNSDDTELKNTPKLNFNNY